METHIDLKFIIQLFGFAVIIVGAGIAWGKQQRQLKEHQQAVDDCNLGDLMTVDKCETFHERAMAVNTVKLENIQDSLTEMKTNRDKVDATLGGLAVKLEVLVDRFDRGVTS